MTEVDFAQLSGQSVLVTGADGFIGSHLVERLVREGADVTAMCLYNSSGSLGWLDELAKAQKPFRAELGDIRDSDFVRRLVQGHDLVLHLAALIAIPYSYQAPRSFVETNVVGTLNVLEACRDSAVGRLVNTSTSEVYGTPETVPIRETHPLQGQSPYSASKIGADQLASAFAKSFDVPVVTVRPFNTYGPRQSQRAIIATVIAQLLAGVPALRLGNTRPKRDFTYVDDNVDGIVRMALADIECGEMIHLGTGTAVSIQQLVEQCMEVVGHVVPIQVDEQRVRPSASEVDVLVSDPQRAFDRLSWHPTVDLTAGLERTVEWMGSLELAADPLSYQR